MPTAVIVSGVFRHFEIAYNSWKFARAAYCLTTQTRRQEARSAAQNSSILANIHEHTHKFDYIVLEEPQSSNNTVNMAAKWLAAYNLLKDKQYSKYIIIRPDLYMFHHNWAMINDIIPEHNTMYNISDIVPDSLGQPFINDMFFILDPVAWTSLGNFYNYYEPKSITKNIHVHLSDYITKHNITVHSHVLAQGIYVPIRENMLSMFDNNVLTDKYSVNDLVKKAIEWQNQQIES
jgi:hypothetical protein